ncbi:hypothetical protein H4Q26_002005 [Puccinia striiformis f. sp. tritici PST-130]|nr:hypothetical protein H4Q26_002005 [Puccinia striiformis f. sp. tritici PST-130]
MTTTTLLEDIQCFHLTIGASVAGALLAARLMDTHDLNLTHGPSEILPLTAANRSSKFQSFIRPSQSANAPLSGASTIYNRPFQEVPKPLTYVGQLYGYLNSLLCSSPFFIGSVFRRRADST